VEKDEQIPTRVPLPEPRALTAKERALIEFLLASPVAREELRLQVETVAVDAVCSCGCPSVWLRVDPATPVAQFSAEESPHPSSRLGSHYRESAEDEGSY
jgi:hypothetical protein